MGQRGLLGRARVSGVALVALAALSLPVSVAVAQSGEPPWMNTSLSPDERVALLLPQMTLEEKVTLMTGDPPQPTGSRTSTPRSRGWGSRSCGRPTSGRGCGLVGRRLPSRWGLRPRRHGTLDLGAPLGRAVAVEARATRTTWCWAQTSTSPATRGGRGSVRRSARIRCCRAGWRRASCAVPSSRRHGGEPQALQRLHAGNQPPSRCKHPKLGRRRAHHPRAVHAPVGVGGRRGPSVRDVRVQPHQWRARVRERLHAGAGPPPRTRLQRVHPERLRRDLRTHRGRGRGRDGYGDGLDHHVWAGPVGRRTRRPGERDADQRAGAKHPAGVFQVRRL